MFLLTYIYKCPLIHPFMAWISKIKLFCITEEEIEAISKTLPQDTPVLKETRCSHHLITEREGEFLSFWGDLSCFCWMQSRCGLQLLGHKELCFLYKYRKSTKQWKYYIKSLQRYKIKCIWGVFFEQQQWFFWLYW